MAVVRSFICVEISGEIRRNLQRMQQRLGRSPAFVSAEGVRWVAPDQLHLTLCFLGEIQWNQTHQVAQIATQVLQSQSRVTFSCEGLGAFPNLERPRVLWAGIREISPGKKRSPSADDVAAESMPECPRFTWMAAALNQAFVEQRFYPDTKPWTPHVTLARFGGAKNERTISLAEEFESFEEHEFGLQAVHELKLMSSERSQAGPVYRPIATIPLGK
ncbi:MAG: RNA 2',3'-cyclic phosphodiesterase [Planctomycetaceae bacterium]|nr:RNA 2',3'-cyclic phosphodiesterase [Planctomycetaceae bacterium]